MRARVSMAVLVLLTATTVPLCASGLDDKIFNQQTIDALALKASQAQPREQCFLYAQLMHQMVEVSLRQYNAGEEEKATGMLKQIQSVAHKIHLTLTDDDKRLKDSEILLRTPPSAYPRCSTTAALKTAKSSSRPSPRSTRRRAKPCSRSSASSSGASQFGVHPPANTSLLAQ